MPMQSTIDGAIITTVNNPIFEKDGKTWAKLSYLREWPKNPRKATKKDLERLKKQILELGIYKPLIITPDGEILGGNHRFKVLSELVKTDKRYEDVWVSVVEAWTDLERIKICISDNDQVADYTREQVEEMIAGFEQMSMFNDYNISFEERQSLKQFVDNLAMSEEELKFKSIKKNLQELGINDETIKTLETMTTYNKMNEDLPDVDLKGCITGQKFPMLFWFDDEIVFEQFKTVFGTKWKDKYDTDKLMNLTEKQLGITFPTSEDKLVELANKIEDLTKSVKEFKELGGNWEKIENNKEKVVETFRALFTKTYPVEANQILFGQNPTNEAN